MERLSDVWAFPAGAGRAVALSRIKFPEPAEGVIRVRSASALCNRRVRTLRASIPNAKGYIFDPKLMVSIKLETILVGNKP